MPYGRGISLIGTVARLVGSLASATRLWGVSRDRKQPDHVAFSTKYFSSEPMAMTIQQAKTNGAVKAAGLRLAT